MVLKDFQRDAKKAERILAFGGVEMQRLLAFYETFLTNYNLPATPNVFPCHYEIVIHQARIPHSENERRSLSAVEHSDGDPLDNRIARRKYFHAGSLRAMILSWPPRPSMRTRRL